MTSYIDPIGKKDNLLFKCDSSLACFNSCCHNLNQTITGFDILNLSRAKNITTDKFIRQYSFLYTGKQTGFPVASLFQQPDKDNACIFLEESGCSVYRARPLSCRLYPAARGISIDKKTKNINEHFAIINEDHCKGFGHGSKMTIEDWLRDQETDVHIQANDILMSLVLKINSGSIEIDKEKRKIIELGCYNLDEFLAKLLNNEIRLDNEINLDELKTNNLLLFKTGIKWTEKQLLEN